MQHLFHKSRLVQEVVKAVRIFNWLGKVEQHMAKEVIKSSSRVTLKRVVKLVIKL